MMQIIRYTVIENCLWLKEFGSPAAAVGKVIYITDKFENLPPFLLNHELIHVAQQARDGLDTYEYNYFVKWANIPYIMKPYEIEAYDHCEDFNYIERAFGYDMELESVQDDRDVQTEIPPQLRRFESYP